MTTAIYRRVIGARLQRAAVLGLLALAAALIAPGAARAQWSTSGTTTSTTNSVGVGTGAPEQSLHVNGASEILSTGSGSGFKFRNRNSATNADDWVWYSTDNVARFWRQGPGDLLGITPSGFLGIGTISPGRRLEVMAPEGDAARLYRNANNVGWGVNITFALNNSSNARTDYAGVHGLVGNPAAGGEGGNLVFSTATAGGLTEKMRLDSAGNFGLGTATPVARLDVVGAANVWGGARYAVNGGHMATGSLTLGNIGANFGGGSGWNTNTAGLLLEAADNTEIAVHDSGTRLASFMHYEGGAANRLNIGRDMGWGGISTVSINGSVGVGTNAPGFKFDVQGGAVNASGGLCIAGDCKTSWSQVGGSQWTSSGSSLLYNSGNVGIATQATATAKLVIGGVAGAEGLDLASADQYANLRVIRNSKSAFDKDLYLQYGAGAGSKIRFYTDNAETMTLVGGNLGLGTAAPVAKLDVNGNINVSGSINAKYQDVAEWVPTKQRLTAGTVVVLDTRHSNHVAASHSAYDTRVAGVISAQPGISLGEAGEGKVLVATTGRVKVKVNATRAPIKIGDLIVTSDVAGVAMKSEPIRFGGRQIHSPGTIIGKALEPLEKGTGEILVLLSLQ